MIFNRYILYLLITVVIIYLLYLQYNKLDESFSNDIEEGNYIKEDINGKTHYFINKCDRDAAMNEYPVIPKPNYLEDEMRIDSNYWRMEKKNTFGQELVRMCDQAYGNCVID